jgi:hypothetical protein
MAAAVPLWMGDLLALTRACLQAPAEDCRPLARRILTEAGIAAGHREATGAAHPLFGDGSVASAALSRPCRREPPLTDAAFRRCLAICLDEIDRVLGRGL